MSNKKKILIYSDCFVYSGSENVIENILNDIKITSLYNIQFYYGYNKTYEAGVKRRFNGQKNISSIRTLSAYHLWGYPLQLDKAKNNSKSFILPTLKYWFFRVIEKLKLFNIINFCQLYRLFRKERPNILYINNGGYPGAASCRVAVYAGKAAGIKYMIFNVNNLAFNPSSFDNYFDRLLCNSISKFITASKAAGKRLINIRNFNALKWEQIPNTLSKKSEMGLDLITCKLRMEFDIKNDEIIIGSVGLLTRRKGYHVLLEAASLIKDKMSGKKVKFFILGEGEERAVLEAQIRVLGLENIFFLPGYRSNVLEYMKDFDIFVTPSIDNEDFPYVIIEAMALGKMVIGTDIAGIPEQIENNKTGFVIEPNNAAALAEKLQFILKQESLLIEMGAEAKKKYFKEYSNQVIMSRYQRLFNSFT